MRITKSRKRAKLAVALLITAAVVFLFGILSSIPILPLPLWWLPFFIPFFWFIVVGWGFWGAAIVVLFWRDAVGNLTPLILRGPPEVKR